MISIYSLLEITIPDNSNEGYDKRFSQLFKELVPGSGSAGTLEGEIVRAAMKIAYRWYNDGDKYYKGYGKETAGPSARFLKQHGFKINAKSAPPTDKGYEDFLNQLMKDVVDRVESKNGEHTPFSGDMYNNLNEITTSKPKDFEEIEVCGHCGGEISNQGYSTDDDWESWTVCNDCGQVEGETVTKYICPYCGDIKDTETCDCLSDSTGPM